MNKKSIEQYLHRPNYNQQLFTHSLQIAQSFQKLMNKADALSPEQQLSLLDKNKKLQVALKNAISAFGKFTDIHKAPLATPLDYTIDIFENISDNIETSVKKYRQASKNNQGEKKSSEKKQVTRPQDQYSFIKPVKFQFHSHEKDLQSIRTDLSFTPSRPLSEKYVYVSSERQLQEMVEELSNQAEIAVDVEHSNKSYEGLTCLIQISSRSKDYIVDVFPLWQSIPLLKRVMEDPKTIKVMHGADMDTKWLQRDFNIHIHNLFDTYRAARVLGMQKLSYAFLLTHYCNVSTDKTYQTADWRQRPLPQQMLHYARLDTHYLLQIFDRLRSDLHQKALSMGLNPMAVFTDVYSTSHEVTRNEAELFEFKNKECLINLQKQYKEPEYLLFEEMFGLLNNVARENDISFDELVTHRVERQLIGKLKELLLVKPENINIKIDRVISDLKSIEHHLHIKDHLPKIKQYLTEYFNNRKEVSKKDKKVTQKARIIHLEEETTHEPIKKNNKYQVSFEQFQGKTYENMKTDPFSMLSFEPIASFVASRFGVASKDQDKAEEAEQESESDGMEVEVSNEMKEEDSNPEGVIEFKRINPNVIYTVEDAEPVEQKYKPRKKRKEEEYEKRLKQKEGNIYELLQD